MTFVAGAVFAWQTQYLDAKVSSYEVLKSLQSSSSKNKGIENSSEEDRGVENSKEEKRERRINI